jgi:hypothetical protein
MGKPARDVPQRRIVIELLLNERNPVWVLLIKAQIEVESL